MDSSGLPHGKRRGIKRDGYIRSGISGWKKGRFCRIKTICNGSVYARPRSEPGGGEIAASSQALVQPPAMAKAPVCARPCWRAPLDGGMMCMCASRRVSGVLFLGGGR